ncbi:unnamed protein product [Rotaria magnacalcarata]|uniref:Uncharacterized protein n=1 Tax=Rotaria magnacalcarata TaxID=392030 RepID=A0A820HA69_9BILA|nr:unnamed protein product [Rotaria magnacalcarata]
MTDGDFINISGVDFRIGDIIIDGVFTIAGIILGDFIFSFSSGRLEGRRLIGGGGSLDDGGVGGSSCRCPSFRFCPGVGAGNHSSNISGSSLRSLKSNEGGCLARPMGDGQAIDLVQIAMTDVTHHNACADVEGWR